MKIRPQAQGALITRRRLLAAAPFVLAKPGYHYEFPRDYFSHPEYQTEWWYYTGNLFEVSDSKTVPRRFGFELTFFRHAFAPDAAPRGWDANPVWLAHFALSDINGSEFYHTERVNRSGPGLAGVDSGRGLVWNGNWQAGQRSLRAVSSNFAISLGVNSTKPPVIHGVNGISQKAAGVGRASHYISETRMDALGSVNVRGTEVAVHGHVWMDHEFFTHQLEPEQTGWDWLSIQLDDKTELMLFRLRRKDGALDPNSAGTWVDTAGRGTHLTASEFRLTPSATDIWQSPATKARYPVAWRIEVPSLGIDLQASTPMRNQELVSKSPYSPSYWEGAMDFRGTQRGRSIAGTGYLEMTGYDKPVKL